MGGLASLSLVCGWFGWSLGHLGDLWVVWLACDWFVAGLWMVCGWSGWFVGSLAGL